MCDGFKSSLEGVAVSGQFSSTDVRRPRLHRQDWQSDQVLFLAPSIGAQTHPVRSLNKLHRCLSSFDNLALIAMLQHSGCGFPTGPFSGLGCTPKLLISKRAPNFSFEQFLNKLANTTIGSYLKNPNFCKSIITMDPTLRSTVLRPLFEVWPSQDYSYIEQFEHMGADVDTYFKTW